MRHRGPDPERPILAHDAADSRDFFDVDQNFRIEHSLADEQQQLGAAGIDAGSLAIFHQRRTRFGYRAGLNELK